MSTPLTVDVTGWLIQQLGTVLPERVASETPADPQGTLEWIPFVQVIRIGGPNDGIVLDDATVAFHCFDARQVDADQLAYRVLRAVHDLRGHAADGAVLNDPRTLSGPSWATTQNTNVRHSVVLMQTRIKTTG